MTSASADSKTCAKGHTYRGDENYRARSGRCPVCFREVQARYDRSRKGLEKHDRYNNSDKGQGRKARYDQSPKGWLNALRSRHRIAMVRRANRATD